MNPAKTEENKQWAIIGLVLLCLFLVAQSSKPQTPHKIGVIPCKVAGVPGISVRLHFSGFFDKAQPDAKRAARIRLKKRLELRRKDTCALCPETDYRLNLEKQHFAGLNEGPWAYVCRSGHDRLSWYSYSWDKRLLDSQRLPIIKCAALAQGLGDFWMEKGNSEMACLFWKIAAAILRFTEQQNILPEALADIQPVLSDKKEEI